jgi:hypothetical protein
MHGIYEHKRTMILSDKFLETEKEYLIKENPIGIQVMV